MTTRSQSPILGASACLFRGSEVLLIQRGRPPRIGAWSLPGGHVEWGETMQAAATRELQEETGLLATLSHFVGIYDIFRHDDAGLVTAHYAISCYGGLYNDGQVAASSDAKAAEWVSQKHVHDYDLAPNILHAIATAQKLLRV
jgi:8-oxo-dGTP diphosphatase